LKYETRSGLYVKETKAKLLRGKKRSRRKIPFFSRGNKEVRYIRKKVGLRYGSLATKKI